MKNKKGFTLIELIAVIVILGLVLIIAIPFFSGSLKTFREEYYTSLNGNMLNAGKQFFSYNRLYLPHNYLDSAIVDANTLNEEKIIKELKDYNGNACDKFESYVIAIRKSKDEVTYDTCLKCLDDNYDNFDEKEACSLAWKEGEGFSEVIFDKPQPVWIYKGTSRSELKKLVITYPDIRRCLGKAGVCEKEIMRVSGKGENGVNPVYPVNLDTVNTNKLGTYDIKYKYESYGTYVDGKVIVYENNPPSVSITKTNKVKTGTITNSDVSKTSSYDKSPSNRNDWAQQLNFTFNYSFGENAKPGLYVTRYQIYFNNRWEDYCIPAKGTNKCTKTETREMDENVKFRTIDSEGHVSVFTENIGLRIDRTKPSCQLRTDGTYGLRQWYITDVKISFQSKDDNYGTKPFPNANPVKSGESFSGVTLSQIKSNTYDTQRTDTNWITWYGYIEDKANNYEICNISFKRDATAPICQLTIPAPDGDDGWHKMPIVTVNFKTHTDTSGQPDYSGVEDYGFNSWNSGTKTINHIEDTAGVTYKGEIRDMAGNKGTCQVSFKKDSTKPECVATRPEPDGDNGWHKMPTVPVTIKSQTDNLSGVRNIGINTWNSGVKRVDHTADTNGITYTYQIRDIAGNMNTCSTWFKKDSTAPKCELIIPGADGDDGWHRMSVVTVNFKTHTDTSGQPDYSDVRDYGINTWNSGVKTVNHTVNSANISYTGQIRDNAGNMSTCSTQFKLDSTPPTCTAKVPEPDGLLDGGSKWHKMPTVKVEINTTGDNLSGVRDYGINSWNSGTKVVNHTSDTAGITYTYQIRDIAGNMSTCSTWFKKDSTAPQCTMGTTGTNGDNGWYKMVNDSTPGKVTASFTGSSDNLSGVKPDSPYIVYSNGERTNVTTVSITGGYFTGHLSDKAGNTNKCDSPKFNFDNIIPTCTAKVPAPDGDEDGGSRWHKMGTVKVEINTTNDNLSGVENYGINTWNSGTQVVNHTADTSSITYTYQVKDRAGNKNSCSVWFKKDSTQPQCAVYTTGTNGNNEWYKMGTVNGAFSSTTDNLSGVRTYGFDSDTGSHTKSTTTSTAGTTWTGYIKDKAGNTNSCTTWFKFDNIAPTCVSGGGSYWTNKNVTLTGTCSDNGYSGCKENISKTYSAEINSSIETPGTVYDNAGNSVECPKNQVVQIDKTDPVCVTTGEQGKWVNYNVTLTGTCSDPNGATHSGCSGNTSATFTSNTNENKTSGNVCDVAGNCITCPYKLVQIDKTAPTCSSSSSPSGWTNGRVTVSGSCSDTGGSGCAGNTSVTRSGQQNTTVSPGTVYDNAGNSVTCPQSAVKIDTTPPTCNTTTTSAGWTNQQVTLTGVCSDTGGSGCKGNSSASFADEQARAHAPANVVDNAGNEGQCNYVNVYIDRTLPTCTVSKSNTNTTSGVTTSVAARDSGGSQLNVGASDSGETGVKSSKTYYVKDYAGNTGSCSVTVTAQGQKRSKSCSSGKACEGAGCQTWNSCANSACGTENCNCSDCKTGSNTCKGGYDTYNIGCTSGCKSGYTHMGNGSANTNGTTCYCQKWLSCKTGSNTCKYGCDTCNKTCRTSGCGCETYNTDIGKCGCAEWGGYGSWSNSSSCSPGETSNHKTTYDCRTLYY